MTAFVLYFTFIFVYSIYLRKNIYSPILMCHMTCEQLLILFHELKWQLRWQ